MLEQKLLNPKLLNFKLLKQEVIRTNVIRTKVVRTKSGVPFVSQTRLLDAQKPKEMLELNSELFLEFLCTGSANSHIPRFFFGTKCFGIADYIICFGFQ
jgi:hypothetical protein